MLDYARCINQILFEDGEAAEMIRCELMINLCHYYYICCIDDITIVKYLAIIENQLSYVELKRNERNHLSKK